MKCNYRNCNKEIVINCDFDKLKKYCSIKHQRNEKKYRSREKPKELLKDF